MTPQCFHVEKNQTSETKCCSTFIDTEQNHSVVHIGNFMQRQTPAQSRAESRVSTGSRYETIDFNVTCFLFLLFRNDHEQRNNNQHAAAETTTLDRSVLIFSSSSHRRLYSGLNKDRIQDT